MFTTIKDKAKKLLNPGRKDPLSRFFQDPEYLQNAEDRNAQILFLKLLMMIAYIDENMDNAELNLIKDYAYEQCLNEIEWREVSYYESNKATREEVENTLNALINDMQSKAEKKEFLNAIQEMIEADSVTSDEEREILELIKNRIESHDVSVFGNIVSRLKNNLVKTGEKYTGFTNAKEYSVNPVAALLKQYGSKDADRAELTGAKLGLAILVINCDSEFHKKELEAFHELVCDETGLEDVQAKELTEKIIKIPENHFELTRLGRILTEKLDLDARRRLLEKMFHIAHADNVFELQEENYLRVVSNALMLSHRDFIDAKLKTS